MNRRALLVVLAAAVLALAQWLSPQKADPGKPREQEWHIPTANGSLQMETTVFRPSGEDKHPLVVINHGSPADGSQRASMGRQRYASLSSFFVAHVYVVAVPLRRGYGATGGRWAEGYGSCKNPDYFDAGLATASDIQATIDYMRKQAFVAANHNIVVGQSAGAWGTVALSSLNPPGVSAMIAFAPGRGGHQPDVGNCEPGALVKAAGRYGSTARVPLLWISAANDTFFEPKLVKRMVAAYNDAGGRATHDAVGKFGNEGHNLASSDSGASIWQPLVEDFLKAK